MRQHPHDFEASFQYQRSRSPRVLQRKTRHETATATILDQAAPPEAPPPPGISTGYLLVFPYAGLFTYRVGPKRLTLDAMSTLFVAPHQEYADTHPVAGIGHASLILRLNRSVLDELCGNGGAHNHPAFEVGAAPASSRLQLMTHALRDPSGQCSTGRRDGVGCGGRRIGLRAAIQ